MDERAAEKRCKNPAAGVFSPVARLRGNIFSGIRAGDRRVLEERKVLRIRENRIGGGRWEDKRAWTESRHGKKEVEV